MNKVTITLICLLLLTQTFAQAETPATQPALPPIVTGTLGKPEDAAKIAAVLGHDGVLVIRSEARWDELNKLLPGLTPDTPLPKFDFATQNIVLVYSTSRRPADAFNLFKFHPTVGPDLSEVFFTLSWDNRPEDDSEVRSSKFVLTVIPATPLVGVTLFSSQIRLVGERPAAQDFSATLGDSKNGGDIVDGLQATVAPKAATIKPGEDILIDFALHLANAPASHPEVFGSLPKSVQVWDAVFSNGYRNHGFFVTTPDGKTTLLRPKEVLDWSDNAPHPVTITAKEPYHLDTPKSLKALGLDTSAPGTYTITGIYEETASVIGDGPGDHTVQWGGSIASNTITVEVKK